MGEPHGHELEKPGTRRELAPALLVALACILASCGGSSGPSKAEYVAKANAVCVSTTKQTGMLIRQISDDAVALSGGDVEAMARLDGAVQQLHALAATDLEQLQRMEQPPGDHAAIARFLTPFAGVVSAIGEAAATLTHHPQFAISRLEEVRPTALRALAGARAYGLRSCENVFKPLA